jgi:hypothetical protein
MVYLKLSDRLFLHIEIICEGTVCVVSSGDQGRPLIRGSELLEFVVGGSFISEEVSSGYDSGYNSQGEQGAHIIIIKILLI